HRIDQLTNELIEGHVFGQRRVEPAGDLLAPAIDVTRAAIIVAQGVVPERQPMLGVTAVVRQQAPDQFPAFVGSFVGQEFGELRRFPFWGITLSGSTPATSSIK